LLELNADRFPYVFANENTETETLDTDISTISSCILYVFRLGHSKQNAL
jgi:hypothetical protein